MRLSRPRIYADTSVIGGCLDDEFQDHSVRLLDSFKTGDSIIVVSDLMLLELELAPPEVQAILEEIPEDLREYVEFTEEAFMLAERYIAAGVVTRTQIVDAQHIAVATVNRVDALVSWNFRHIVNLERIRGFNSVNLRHGCPILEIRTPREVMRYEAE